MSKIAERGAIYDAITEYYAGVESSNNRLAGAGQLQAMVYEYLAAGITEPANRLTPKGRVQGFIWDDNTARALAIIRSYGTDAHVYLPGIGVINGLTAGNYLDSAGTTAATVDNPVGLVLDGAGSVGAELNTNAGNPFVNTTGWITTGTGSVSVVNGLLRASATTLSHAIYRVIPVTAGKSYVITFKTLNNTFTQLKYSVFNATSLSDIIPVTNYTSGENRLQFTAPAGCISVWVYITRNSTYSGSVDVEYYSVKEITGIHATQATTANKPILRYASGRYYFDFVDGTDVLTATFPAGYESATTINASTAGQTTLTAQNIVGAYNIGPSTDTYGRFVFRTGLTASELAIMQQFANRLAGL